MNYDKLHSEVMSEFCLNFVQNKKGYGGHVLPLFGIDGEDIEDFLSLNLRKAYEQGVRDVIAKIESLKKL